jgi:hypothetical protein
MVMDHWWKENVEAVATAVDAAEKTSGHQILVRVGRLGLRPNRTADAIAAKYPGASLVFCVDPRRRAFEIRWSSHISLDSAIVADTAREPLRLHDLPAAVTAVAALLPRQAEGEELPDIVDDQGR